MSVLKDISELVEAGIISQETGARIEAYYRQQKSPSMNRLFVVFGILGAILVGLGIILIVAHNWDELSGGLKTGLAFLPLIIGQGACAFALFRKTDNITWREGSGAFLFFAVGATISLISQIYNISGDLSGFILTWMLLCAPLIYILRSSVVSMLYLIGITYYATETGYLSYPGSEPYIYCLLLTIAIPYYYTLFRKSPGSNFTVFHHWLFPLSIIIVLGTFAVHTETLMFIAYFSLFGLLFQISQSGSLKSLKPMQNGYYILGNMGTIFLLMMLSFNWLWHELIQKKMELNQVIVSPEFLIAAILSLSAGGLLYLRQKNKPISDIKPVSIIFILFIIVFVLGLYSPFSIVLINLITFATGILTIREGNKREHLGILNYGLLIITVLIICRFFDSDLSFVARGLLFVLVGVGFFITNYRMLKKRKAHE